MNHLSAEHSPDPQDLLINLLTAQRESSSTKLFKTRPCLIPTTQVDTGTVIIIPFYGWWALVRGSSRNRAERGLEHFPMCLRFQPHTVVSILDYITEVDFHTIFWEFTQGYKTCFLLFIIMGNHYACQVHIRSYFLWSMEKKKSPNSSLWQTLE